MEHGLDDDALRISDCLQSGVLDCASKNPPSDVPVVVAGAGLVNPGIPSPGVAVVAAGAGDAKPGSSDEPAVGAVAGIVRRWGKPPSELTSLKVIVFAFGVAMPEIDVALPAR